MKRGTLLLVVDLLCLLAGMGIAATGLLIRYVLPPGSAGRRGGVMSLWSWDRHDWGEAHFWLSAVCVGLLAVHVGLHWTWVCEMVRRRLRCQTGESSDRGANWLYGAAMVFVLLGLLAGFLLVAGRLVQSEV